MKGRIDPHLRSLIREDPDEARRIVYGNTPRPNMSENANAERYRPPEHQQRPTTPSERELREAANKLLKEARVNVWGTAYIVDSEHIERLRALAVPPAPKLGQANIQHRAPAPEPSEPLCAECGVSAMFHLPGASHKFVPASEGLALRPEPSALDDRDLSEILADIMVDARKLEARIAGALSPASLPVGGGKDVYGELEAVWNFLDSFGSSAAELRAIVERAADHIEATDTELAMWLRATEGERE